MQSVHWSHRCSTDGLCQVMPDGCRDVLRIKRHNGSAETLVTELDARPRTIRFAAGDVFEGWRFRPGLVPMLDDAVGSQWENAELPVPLDGHAGDHELAEIVDELALAGSSLRQVARQAGVSVRTLQRHFRSRMMPVPDFWRLLGRARRAAVALPNALTLTDIAGEFGYSDQAHMTREFRRWFGASPARLREDKRLVALIAEPGLGNWPQAANQA